MEGMEFKVLREGLGLSQKWVAWQTEVLERQVRRWENGVSHVPADVAELIHRMADMARFMVDELVEQAEYVGEAVLGVWETDEELWAEFPAMRPTPAAFVRMVVFRASEDMLVPCRIVSAGAGVDWDAVLEKWVDEK